MTRRSQLPFVVSETLYLGPYKAGRSRESITLYEPTLISTMAFIPGVIGWCEPGIDYQLVSDRLPEPTVLFGMGEKAGFRDSVE